MEKGTMVLQLQLLVTSQSLKGCIWQFCGKMGWNGRDIQSNWENERETLYVG